MIKFLLLSFTLIFLIIIVRLILIVLASLYYKEEIKNNIELKPKIVLIESSIFILLFTLSFWFIDNYLDSKYIILLFSLFFISLIPSYNFIISPLKYLFSKKGHLRNYELEKKIKEKGFDYNLILIKGEVLNAYATGILPFSKTILIGERLKNKMNNENLTSIIYHEIGHLKLNHLTKLYFINTLLSLFSLVAFFTRQYLLEEVESTIYEPLSIFILGLFIGLCFWYIPGKIQYKLELEADYFASKIVGAKKYEKALIELDSLSDGLVSKGGITHPNLLKRIENIYKK